ncbi:hypothetical protein [Pyxidicoccus xibeiensis]|uniref:hypothetical protein n=1 Tax=Pyxidicoccus xibeiensis TaxID=2906759 RepID=UPI0020A809CA|nr:hypothetical protein [Pyxidicoccus xibeiensis]MCP3141552.1 hypothetical protein [Pyxidicoccus xibeiensis]
MFTKRMFRRSMLLVVGLSALGLGGFHTSASVEAEDITVAAVSQELTSSEGEPSVAACRPGCYGPCWTCILGVCENTCM